MNTCNATDNQRATLRYPRFLVAGDGGLVVEFGDRIDKQINARVLALAGAIENNPIPGMRELVPTYRSLFVSYDPLQVDWAQVRDAVCDRLAESQSVSIAARRWTIPVFYGPPDGFDLEFVAQTHGLSTDEVIRIHSDVIYSVFMIGFSPGYAYLGGLPEILHTSRRTKPRQTTPAGGIALGGIQASISSVAAPSGWHFIGRTPVRLFEPEREEPFLLQSGDEIRFQPISLEEYETLEKQCEAGALGATQEPAG